MANLLAKMTAPKGLLTLFSTTRIAVFAIDFRHKFFTAIAKTINYLKTGWAITVVAVKRAGMTACKFLLARTSAARVWYSTFNGRVEFGNTTRAK